jgi:hypothetical protein
MRNARLRRRGPISERLLAQKILRFVRPKRHNANACTDHGGAARDEQSL